MRRKRLSGKEVKLLNGQLKEAFGLEDFLDKKDNVELVEERFLLVNGELYFFYFEGRIAPSLRLVLKKDFLGKVVIDMPAVRFIANGADVMKPGIREMDSFRKGDFVAVVDENNRKPLAIGIALFSAEEIGAMDGGKVVKNLHHVGDDFWNNILK